MIKYVISIFFIGSALFCQGQSITFTNKSDVKKVYKGSIVKISADSAYIVGTIRAVYINDRLDELDSVQVLYNDLVDSRNELVRTLKETHKTLTQLLHQMHGDSAAISHNTAEIITALDQSLNNLKDNNEELKTNNKALSTEIKNLEILVKKLKKETKGLWWSNATDKIVAFVGGVGIGLLITIL